MKASKIIEEYRLEVMVDKMLNVRITPVFKVWYKNWDKIETIADPNPWVNKFYNQGAK